MLPNRGLCAGEVVGQVREEAGRKTESSKQWGDVEQLLSEKWILIGELEDECWEDHMESAKYREQEKLT